MQIFPNFPNGLVTRENLCWAAIRFNYGFNVAIAIMVLYVDASVDEWNASIALSKEHANQILGSI